MSEPTSDDHALVALTLRIRAEPEPIRGDLSDAAGSTWPFVGWLELFSAVDAARATSRAGFAPAPARTDRHERSAGHDDDGGLR